MPFSIVRRLPRRCYATARNDGNFFVRRCFLFFRQPEKKAYLIKIRFY
ncbi:MAG: hypothetical protein IJV35_07420 [Neisseriaceae bacterium]|nr:hypothetical protein [Neisseriaceae bacterium]